MSASSMNDSNLKLVRNDFSNMSLDEKVQQFRPKEQREHRKNKALHELQAIFQILATLAVQIHFQESSIESEKPHWDKLFKSGNIFRTKRRLPEPSKLTQLILHLNSLLEEPYKNHTNAKTGEIKSAYKVAAESLIETIDALLETYKEFPTGEQLVEKFKNDEAAKPITRKIIILQVLQDDFIALCREVSKAVLNDPETIMSRPPEHIFFGNPIVSTEMMAFVVQFHEDGVSTENIVSDDGENVALYNALGQQEEVNKFLYLALPKWIVRILSTIMPGFNELYKHATGVDVKDRLRQKKDHPQVEEFNKMPKGDLLRKFKR